MLEKKLGALLLVLSAFFIRSVEAGEMLPSHLLNSRQTPPSSKKNHASEAAESPIADSPPSSAKDTGETTRMREIIREEIAYALSQYTGKVEEIAAAAFQKSRRKSKLKKALEGPDSEKIFKTHAHPFWGKGASAQVAVIFTDPYCSHCHEAMDAFESYLKKAPQNKLIIHNYPLFGKESQRAVKAFLAAHCQGQYIKFYKAFRSKFTQLQKALSDPQLLEIAVSLGLQEAQFKQDCQGERVSSLLLETVRLGQLFQVTGTPTFIVMEKKHPNGKETRSGKRVIEGIATPQECFENGF
jgi:protein-disulfide isomerase